MILREISRALQLFGSCRGHREQAKRTDGLCRVLAYAAPLQIAQLFESRPIAHVLLLEQDRLAYGRVLLSQFIIFILGWPLEWTEIIVIFMPIFIPLLPKFGVDPLFFGLLVALNLQTAFLSPPVALAAFYLKGVSPKHVTLNQIFAGMMPFMGIQVIALALLYIWPQIGMWLPTLLYK